MNQIAKTKEMQINPITPISLVFGKSFDSKLNMINSKLDKLLQMGLQWGQVSNLDNYTYAQDASEEGVDMAKIDRRVVIGDNTLRIRASTEEEYAQKLFAAMNGVTISLDTAKSKHNFRDYAQKWFEVYSKPNIEMVTAITYERQLNNYIFPAFGNMAVEDIQASDVQAMLNGMKGAKATKNKCTMVLNMIFLQAIEDKLIQFNPLKSRSIRITGNASKTTEPYSVEQMRFLVSRIGVVENETDRTYLALQAVHPMRLEEVLGLRWRDIDLVAKKIHINRAVTHPDRNQPIVKDLKTEASSRTIDLVPQIIPFLKQGKPEDFVIGNDKPYSYTQVRRMCGRIEKDTGFSDKITPIRFRTTVLTDLYDATKDIKQAQAAAGHTTAEMTLKYYVKGRDICRNTASPIANTYGLA